MKTSWLIIRMLCLSLLVLSCAREVPAGEEAEQGGKGRLYTFKAVIGEAVKTSVAEDGKVSWSEGDQIAVWDEVSSTYCTFTSEAGDGVFSFTGEPGKEYCFTSAVYPVSMAKAPGTVTLPAAYTMEEALSGSLYPMVAEVDDTAETLQFMHVGALLKYTVFGIPESATSLELSSAETTLSGDFALEGAGFDDGWATGEGEDVTTEPGTLPVKSADTPAEIHSAAGDGKVSISLPSGHGGGAVLYIPLPVGAYSCTLSIKEGSAVTMEHTTRTLKDIARRKLVRITYMIGSFSGGQGTEAEPYRIGSPSDIERMSIAAADEPFKSAHYSLTSDIDMSSVSDFRPIGGASEATAFTGSLNGNGHTISNLKVDASSHAGLFGYLRGTVKNLNISGATISAKGNYAAAIAAVVSGGSIESCRVDAATDISAGGFMAGGIAGLVHSGTVNACASHANISAYQAVGGIAGCLNPAADGENVLVINCTYEPVYKDGKRAAACLRTEYQVAYMGGIAGTATYCADLTGEARSLKNSTIKIVNCYAFPLELSSSQSASTAIYHIGGILGRADGATTVFNCISPITYSNILRSGTRVAANAYSGLTSAAAIVGRIYTAGGTVTRTFSSQAWRKVYGNPGNVDVAHSLNTVRLGDGNMRGYGSTVLNGTEYTEEQGGLAAALNAGVTAWNEGNPVKALTWAYDPTFGYPKPAGVDVPGVTTKKVSIIGDSISTYDGYMFSNDNYTQGKFYPDTGYAGKYADMVFNEQYTWWWRLIYDKMDNARLEVLSAWGGTTVSYLTAQTEHSAAPSASSQVNSLQGRYRDYGLGKPDVLFYFGGRNDFAAVGGKNAAEGYSHDLLGDSSDESLQAAFDNPSPTLYDNYSQGTVAILKHFHDANPGAKIMLMITDLMSDEYEDGAAAICTFLSGKGYDIRFANLHERGTTNKRNDVIGVVKERGSHFNQVGCENVAAYIWDNLGSWLNE